MRSIRLSLTIYFLALLAVALGGASVLVYRTTASSLRARQRAGEEQLRDKRDAFAELLRGKQRATRVRLNTTFSFDRRREERSLNTALLSQAQILARLVQFQFDMEPYWDRYHAGAYNFLGSLGAATAPNGHLLIPLLVAEGSPRPPLPERSERPGRGAPHRRPESFREHLYRHHVFPSMKAEIKLKDNDLLQHVDEDVAEYFQINGDWGSVYHSKKMAGCTFDFDPGVFRSKDVLGVPHFGETRLGPKLRVRRVMIRAPAARIVPYGGSPGRWPRGRPPDEWDQPAIFIQVACDARKLDSAVAGLKRELDRETKELKARHDEELAQLDSRLGEDLARADAETGATLASLRNQLLLLCLFTFAAVVLGTFGLVRLGLAPLHRLSEAVSRVSEKDFRLQLDDRPLPRELSPISERLSQALEQLKRAFAREKQATADISHELRTPLSALMTTIDVSLRKPRPAPEYREALEDCRQSAQQINEAVERLLSLARLDAGVDRLRVQSVDAAALARQCVSVVRPLAEAHRLSLKVEAGAAAPLQTDPDKLKEVLNNLLHNAIEYNREGGSIEVAVQRDNGHLELRVTDTGIGIPADARPHIFERFFRADPSRQADGMHAGLGLAIVKGYVDLMGGSIDVESVEGQGSTFNVRLPA